MHESLNPRYVKIILALVGVLFLFLLIFNDYAIDFFLSYLLLYRYLTLFILVSLAGFIVPIPINVLLMAVGALSVKGFFDFRTDLVSRNLLLQDEISSLKLKEIDYDTLFKENQDLKNVLSRNSVSSKIMARVLSKPPVSPYDTFVVDAGVSEEVSLGNKVYLSGNIIIGKISSITSKTSIVELFSSGGVKQEAILSRTGASFILNGHGGANFTLEVPKDTDIVWGDVFLYPGPQSILGSVYYINTNAQSSFKTIYLRIPGNVFVAKYVFVEK